MLSRWLDITTGRVQLYLLPTAVVTMRDGSTTHSVDVSIGGSEALRTCRQGGSALPSLQSLSPLPNTTSVHTCVRENVYVL